MMRTLMRLMLTISLFVSEPLFGKSNMPDSEKLIDQIINEVEQSLSRKYNLYPIGVITSMPGGTIKLLGLDFNATGPLSKETLRSILINSAQYFAEIVNRNNKISSFLKNSKFGIENVEITIFIKSHSGYCIEHPSIGVASINKGNLKYITVLYQNGLPNYETTVTETYEEALKAVQEASQQDKPVSSSVKKESSRIQF